MQEFPLLDLRDAWLGALRTLQDIRTLAETLYKDSDRTWTEMLLVQNKVLCATAALGRLPLGIREGIAQDEADLQEMED